VRIAIRCGQLVLAKPAWRAVGATERDELAAA
jgi:hypothetical protein